MELDDRKKIPFDTHYDHHVWVSEKKTEEKIRKEQKQKIFTSVITGLILSITFSLGTVIWYAIQSFVASGGK